MRLLDLQPEWRHWRVGDSLAPASSRERAIGVSFDCPVHGDKHRVYVDFANPFDGAPPVTRTHLWTRTGETFETLSVTPSVDYTRYDNGTLRDATCWHGHLTNGEIA